MTQQIGTAGIEPARWLFPCFFCQDRSHPGVKGYLAQKCPITHTRTLREDPQFPTSRNAPISSKVRPTSALPDRYVFRFLTRLVFWLPTGGGFVLLFVLTDSTGEHLSRFRHRSNSLRDNCKLTRFNEEKAPRLVRVRICTLHEDDFFQCRVIAMVVLALILNELFLLASHLLPVDPVYLFRHRTT